MIDILKSDLAIKEQEFWREIGYRLTKQIKGENQILYNDIENSIVVKIFINRFNYSICMTFPRWKLFEFSELLNHILNAVKLNIYEEVFK